MDPKLVDQSRGGHVAEKHVEVTHEQEQEQQQGGQQEQQRRVPAPPSQLDQSRFVDASESLSEGGGFDEGPTTPAPSTAPSGALDSPTVRSARGGGFGGGGGGVSPEALAAGLSRAAAALGSGGGVGGGGGGRQQQQQQPQLRPSASPTATSSQRRAPPSPTKEVRFAEAPQRGGEIGPEKEEEGKSKKASEEEEASPPPSSPPPTSVLSEALQPLVSAAGEAAPRSLREARVRLARGAAGLARDVLLPPPSLLPFRVPSAFSGASPTAPQQGFLARARAEGLTGLAADLRSAGSQGSIRAIALAQPWLEGGAVVAVAAWRKAEDAFAAAVGGGDGESGGEESEEEQEQRQPRASPAAASASAASPQQQGQDHEQEQGQQRLSFPALDKAAGLAFGLSLLWLVLGVPPAALFGVFCVLVSHSLAREGMRFVRLHSGGGWAGGRMRRVARRIRRDRSKQQKQKQKQAAAGGGGASPSAAANANEE